MMRAAKIQNGIVENVIETEVDASAYGFISCPTEVGPGWTYDGETFSPPAPKVVSASLSELVRAERDRRKCALVGVDTLEDLQAAIIYGMQDATDLLDIRQSRQWTDAEAARAAQLRAVREALSLLDYTAIALIAAGVEDYENNEHWPV